MLRLPPFLATLGLYLLAPVLIVTLLFHALFDLPAIIGGLVDEARGEDLARFWSPGMGVSLTLYLLLFALLCFAGS